MTRNEKRGLSPIVQNAEKTGKAPKDLPPVVSELTQYKMGKPIALGFVLGAAYFLHALATGSAAGISLVQLLLQLAGLIGLCTIACICFKRWMGKQWGKQHRFVMTSLFLGNLFYGIALFVMVFGAFGFLFMRG